MNIAVIMDVSGSIPKSDFTDMLLPTVDGLVKAHPGQVIVFFVDHKVHDKVYSGEDILTASVLEEENLLDRIAAGGSDIMGAVREVMKLNNYDRVVVISDGHFG